MPLLILMNVLERAIIILCITDKSVPNLLPRGKKKKLVTSAEMIPKQQVTSVTSKLIIYSHSDCPDGNMTLPLSGRRYPPSILCVNQN